jgi:hypothetical protein
VKNFDNFIELEVAISRVRVYDAPPCILTSIIIYQMMTIENHRPESATECFSISADNAVTVHFVMLTRLSVNYVKSFCRYDRLKSTYHLAVVFMFTLHDFIFYNMYKRTTLALCY